MGRAGPGQTGLSRLPNFKNSKVRRCNMLCSACTAGPTRRDAINARLMEGLTLASISREFGLSEDILRRHRTKCIPDLLARVKAQDETLTAEMLMGILSDVREKAYAIYRQVA